MKKLILGSTSVYRQELLKKLGVPFTSARPLVDEEKEKDPQLTPLELAKKLAFIKAQSLAAPGSVVIGGDQLVQLDGKIFGKSHKPDKALEQLSEMQGKTHELITAVTVFNELVPMSFVNITRLTMRSLSQEQLKQYITLDNPVDCAGSYKIEAHGISLFEKIETTDFTAIQGLPLIELANVLQRCDLSLLSAR